MRHGLGPLHSRLAPHRRVLFASTALLIAVCTVWLTRLVVREDIQTMLPESGTIAEDFALLRQAPFARRLTVTVSHPGGNAATAARLLAESLRRQPEFTHVMTGPSRRMDVGFLARVPDLALALLDATDLRELENRLDIRSIHAALERNRNTLLGPGGLALKDAVNRDPLGIRDLVLAKLTPLARFAQVRIENGQFISQDGMHALILADTDIPMTDSRGAATLMAALDRAKSALPDGARVMLLGGHRHTLANAEVIKADLKRILPASLLALAIIFLLFLRSPQSILVFLVPVSVMSVAGVGTAAIHGDISGIVLGFGAVLLGISVDYALHVFLALRAGHEYEGRTAATVLQDVARPVIFGALTSFTAFAALLVSDIPGIRQLATFSMIGLGASLLLSLVVLPHGITPRGPTTTATQPAAPRRSPAHTIRRVTLTAVWVVILACGWGAGTHLRINGDPRALSHVSVSLRDDETATRAIWGGMRDMAMIVTSGTDSDYARDGNDAVWDYLRTTGRGQNVMSLAPAWPGPTKQQAAMAAWKQFWTEHGPDTLRILTTEKHKLGYSTASFTPFAEALRRDPAPITAETIDALGLRDLVAMLTVQDAGQIRIMTLLPDTADLNGLSDAVGRLNPKARLVSGGRFRDLLGQTMTRDVTRFCGLALGAVISLVFLLHRDPTRSMLALLPVGAGLVAVLSVMALTGQDVNLFHVVSFPLIMGLSADYGIFMTSGTGRPRTSTIQSVLLSGLTTLVGFGALVLARHPALHSLGMTVLTGIGAAMLTARWGIPLLQRRTA